MAMTLRDDLLEKFTVVIRATVKGGASSVSIASASCGVMANPCCRS